MGDVRTFRYDDSFTIANITVANHVLSQGAVWRSVVLAGDDIYIRTLGHGVGVAPDTNNFFAPFIWDSVDHGAMKNIPMTPRRR